MKDVQKWVEEQRSQGYSDAEIKEGLRKTGTSIGELPRATTKKDNHKLILSAAVVITIAILGFSGYFSYSSANETPPIADLNTIISPDKLDENHEEINVGTLHEYLSQLDPKEIVYLDTNNGYYEGEVGDLDLSTVTNQNLTTVRLFDEEVASNQMNNS